MGFLGVSMVFFNGFSSWLLNSIWTEAKAQPVEGFAGAGELFAMEVDTQAAMQRFQETVWGAQLGKGRYGDPGICWVISWDDAGFFLLILCPVATKIFSRHLLQVKHGQTISCHCWAIWVVT